MDPRDKPSTAGVCLLPYGLQLCAEGLALLNRLCPRSKQSGHYRYSCICFARSVCLQLFVPHAVPSLSFTQLQVKFHPVYDKPGALSGFSIMQPTLGYSTWVPANPHYHRPDPMKSGRHLHPLPSDVAGWSPGMSSCADSV